MAQTGNNSRLNHKFGHDHYFNFGKHKGKNVYEIPGKYLLWTLHNLDLRDTTRDHVTTCLSKCGSSNDPHSWHLIKEYGKRYFVCDECKMEGPPITYVRCDGCDIEKCQASMKTPTTCWSCVTKGPPGKAALPELRPLERQRAVPYDTRRGGYSYQNPSSADGKNTDVRSDAFRPRDRT